MPRRFPIKIPDLSLRALALFLAVVLWFVATERPQNDLNLDRRELSVSLDIANLDDNLELTAAPASVQVEVAGPRWILPFQAPETRARLDLAGLGPGEHHVAVQVAVPQGLSLVSANPREARVVLEERVRRTVPVQVTLTGVPPGVSVSVVAVEPFEMDVIGAASAVARVSGALARVAYESGGGATPVVAVDATGSPVAGVAVLRPIVEVTLEVTGRQ